MGAPAQVGQGGVVENAHARSPTKRKVTSLDKRSVALLNRFLADWVWPRWRQLIGTLILRAILAAQTSGYAVIIKHSFESLISGHPGALPLVLGGIVVLTLTRSAFLYLQTVATNRFVLRIATDIQKLAFAHLVVADFARLSRDPRGHLLSTLTNDVQSIVQGAQAALNPAIRRPDRRRPVLHDALPRLDHDARRAVHLPDRGAADHSGQHAPQALHEAHAGGAWRYDVAARRIFRSRAADQDLPPRELRDRWRARQLREDAGPADEGCPGTGKSRPPAGSARGRRCGQRRRIRLLAHRQRRLDGRRLHGLCQCPAHGGPADPRSWQPVGPRSGRTGRCRPAL